MSPQREDQERLRALLDRWLAKSSMFAQWVNYGPIQIYLRKTPVTWKEKMYDKAITIANVSVAHNQQKKGWFTVCADWALNQDVSIVKVENVVTPKMANYLRNRSWETNCEDPPSFAKVLRS